MLPITMAQGLTPTSRAQLLGGLLATGVVAPLVVVGSVGLEVQAQEQQLPPSSQQVDRPGITPAEPAGVIPVSYTHLTLPTTVIV